MFAFDRRWELSKTWLIKNTFKTIVLKLNNSAKAELTLNFERNVLISALLTSVSGVGVSIL